MSALFDRLKASNRAALIPYLTAGFPEPRATLPLLEVLADAGADAIELGIPFSDPQADGPVIQRASERALSRGMTLAAALEIAREFRRRWATPLYVMSYANPIGAYGPPRYFERAARVGLAGTVVPDLPPEESDGWRQEAEAHGVPLVFLCAPTTSARRMRLIDRASRDFIYLVSLRGVTGARQQLPPGLAGFVRRVRKLTTHPLCVGFGIARPDHARAVTRLADGVIVGSALIRLIEQWGAGRIGRWRVARFIRSMSAACRRPGGGR
jgi:tryptophan synthase alpha chain